MWGAGSVRRFGGVNGGAACAISHASAVQILPPKNPSPPRHLAPLLHALSPAFVLSHSLTGGLVLVAIMVVLCVVPTRAERRFPFSLFFLGGLDAFLDGRRGLTTVVAGRSATLRFRRHSGCEKSEG